jgi:hypothetical protein
MNRTMTGSADTSGGGTTSAAASSGPDPAWLLEGLPKCSVRYGRHASTTIPEAAVMAATAATAARSPHRSARIPARHASATPGSTGVVAL